MATIHVQFADASKSKVVSVFAGPQDPDYFANLGEVADDDPRYLAFIRPPWSPNRILGQMQAPLDVATSRLSILAGKAFRAGDTATATACDTAIDALLAIDQRPEVKVATDDASLIAALTAAYAEIVAATPAAVQAAFAEFRL